MEQAAITIACQGATTVSLDELLDLQGNLKDLDEGNYVKLRNSMLEYGFSFPIFFWTNESGQKFILDAHQRVRTLRKMQAEGHTIPPLPADPIFAKDKTEAKKKLLLLNSRYGKMTREGFDEFVDEPDSPIDESIEDLLVLPEITMWDGNENTEEQNDGQPKEKQLQELTCPACQHKFTV